LKADSINKRLLNKMMALRVIMLLGVVLIALQQEGQAIDIVAAGASFPERLYHSLAFAFASELPQYSLSYTSLGSGKGKCRILDFSKECKAGDNDNPKVLDWAGSDSIHTSADYQNYSDVQMFPAVAGAVVAVYNLDGVDDLILPTSVLTKIFRKCNSDGICPPGWISRWNDSAIIASNPHVPVSTLTAAGEITVVVRADGSGTTEIFKQAMALFSADFATQLGAANLKDTAVWNNTDVIKGNTNRGVAAVVLATKGAIGYVSLDEATSAGLKFAGIGSSILNTDGVLRATAKSVEYALVERGFSFGNNGDQVSHLTASVMGAVGSEAWPIVGYTVRFTKIKTLIRPQSFTCD
jgi:phosphate transport system substrate-binding protein